MKTRFFRRVDVEEIPVPATALSIADRISYGFVELVQRAAFTVIGIILLLWAWQVLSAQVASYPRVDWMAVIVGLVALVLGIRNAVSLIKDVSWGQVFFTLLFVVFNAYLIWFT